MRIAQILHGGAHWIFEADKMPSWPPDQEGNPIVLADITGQPEVCETWEFNAGSGTFSEPIAAPDIE